jgi:ADP-ribose pyrophosphatase
LSERSIEILEKEQTERGYLKIERYNFRHELFEGGMTPPLMREVMVRGEVVAVLPYDPITGQVVLIEQFRIGAYRAQKPAWLTEIVAGVIEEGEAPSEVARREALEEIGTSLKRLTPIGRYLVSPGCSDEFMYLYCGEVDASGIGGNHGLAHEGEDIRAFSLPADEALALLENKGLSNFPIVLALQWFALNHKRLQAQWTA